MSHFSYQAWLPGHCRELVASASFSPNRDELIETRRYGEEPVIPPPVREWECDCIRAHVSFLY